MDNKYIMNIKAISAPVRLTDLEGYLTTISNPTNLKTNVRSKYISAPIQAHPNASNASFLQIASHNTCQCPAKSAIT
jgi:hypothetical protein